LILLLSGRGQFDYTAPFPEEVMLIASLSWRGQVDCPLPLLGGIGYLSLTSGWVRLIPHPPFLTWKVCADCHSSRRVRLIVPRKELILPTVPSVPLIWMYEQYTFLNFILVFNILDVYLLESASSWVGACGFIPCAVFHWRPLAVSPDNVIRGHRSLERRNCYEKCESRENNYCPTPLTFSRVQGKDSTIVMLNKSFPGC
jgi:hypothetical protein